ncbi:MAG TPA: hypothetical protein VD905_20645, partial [Flavobacteriales bacterium]|nr:hypothetical protein [Flavobacteriales bacterium]
MSCQLFIPFTAKALTSGPTQPEVQSFSPVGTSDMVDLFSGDFSYNIPLLDVDGYPINISYHSGIAMDDEASWVGLGWNINAGVINRNMRGIPDEFNGDEITKETNMRPNRTFGLSGGISGELFGKKLDKLSIGGVDSVVSLGFSPKLGFNFNNYRGVGVELSASLNLSVAIPGVGGLNSGLGLTSSSENGLALSPSLSFSRRYGKTENVSGDLGANTLRASVGTAINSRSGMKQLSIGVSSSFVKDNGKTQFAKTSYAPEATARFTFGQNTYTPSGGPNMKNISITGNFKTGGELFGLTGTVDISGYYSQQKLEETTVTNPAYGYMNHEQGTNVSNALFDFNRENDGSFTQNTPALALAQQTFDMYNVSGQGVGGSYRVVRSDYSYVNDPETKTSSDGYDIGVEVGIGNIAHSGGDLTVTDNNTTTGMWKDDNNAKGSLKPKSTNGAKAYEKFYFKEASEKTIEGDEFYATYGQNNAMRVNLKDNGDFNVVADNKLETSGGSSLAMPTTNTRSKREKRSQVMYALSKYDVTNGGGLEPLKTGSYAQSTAPNHHIAEITTYSNDGFRYVYGLPAFNTTQKDITFAVGARLYSNDGAVGDCATGLVPYNTNDNSLSNDRGLDNYYSATTTPAYAHSYLITAVLSPDYIDSDGTQGPSDNDLGYYTKFYYERIGDYKWRSPYTSSANYASYNEGIKTDINDDKANIIYGEKELYYLDSIVTKNYIAIFHKSDRLDGREAAGVNGGVGTKKMKRLDKISLYSRWDYRNNPATAVPLKEVHFVYDYSLCDGVPNNPSGSGKLTLKEVYFTYQDSQKAKFSSYKFEYNGLNPNYSFKANDRWGNYKALPGSPGCGNTGNLVPAEFPYTPQDTATANSYASAWHVTDIKLPSGGKIHVDYESDDYAYVQNKPAMQMFKIAGYEGQTFPSAENDATNITDDGKKIYFNLQNGETDISKYVSKGQLVYFRFLMETNSGNHDYVSGYFKVAACSTQTVSGTLYGYVVPEAVDINDAAASQDVNPITKAAVQYCRLNLPRYIYDQPAIDDSHTFGLETLNSLVSVFSNFSAAVQGENQWILSKGKCEEAILKKSWIRLNSPTGHKQGGGVRVKKIVMTDEWEDMTDSAMETANYGQEYSYTLEDGTSSGVAAYEPQLGGDENVWKQPIFTNEKNLLAPDTEHYVEEPFGESFFPAASVGYSRVTVKNLDRAGVTKHATGKVVHEFFTAKDFPTIVQRTSVETIQDKTDPFSITSMFYVRSKDYMNASQGFYIELNDMHGKPKKQSVYQGGKEDPITSVEYKYKTEPYLNGSYRLTNSCQVIEPDGTISNKNIGLVMD